MNRVRCTLGAMGNRAARLAAFAVAAIAVAAAGCRRSPVAAHSADAGGEPTGAPSVSDAAREPLDAGVETPTDASTDADLDLDTSDVARTGDAPPPTRPWTTPNTGDGPAHPRPSADTPLDVRRDVPRTARSPTARSPTAPTSAPKTSRAARRVSTAHRSRATSRAAFANRPVRRTTTASRASPATPACAASGSPRPAPRAMNVASGFCAQGVCCATACAGPCRSCALPGSFGTCTTVPRGALDPVRHLRRRRHLQRAGRVRPGTCVADTDCGDLYCARPGTASRATPPALRRPRVPPRSASCETSARTAALPTPAPPRSAWL